MPAIEAPHVLAYIDTDSGESWWVRFDDAPGSYGEAIEQIARWELTGQIPEEAGLQMMASVWEICEEECCGK